MDHVRIANNVAVCFKDIVPGDAVFGTDLAEIVARLHGIGISSAACGIALGVNVQHQVARTIIRINAIVFVPKLLLGFCARRGAVNVKNAIAFAQRVSRAVLVGQLK